LLFLIPVDDDHDVDLLLLFLITVDDDHDVDLLVYKPRFYSVHVLFMMEVPFSALLIGPSGCGKTRLLVDILKRQPFVNERDPLREIHFFYQNWQPIYDELLRIKHIHITFYKFWVAKAARVDETCATDKLEMLIQQETTNKTPGAVAFVFDDGLEVSRCQIMVEVFTRMSHHYCCTVFLLAQNLFQPSLRVISRNVNYLFLFRCPRDQTQIRHIAYQIYPEKGQAKAFMHTFKEVTSSHPYGYIMLDFKPETRDQLRVRTNILEREPSVFCFEENV
jgi:hypothetical protein